MQILIYVNFASTTDRSTLLLYRLRVGSERFARKKFDLHLHIYKRLVDGTKVQ